ncbi:DUF6220 domain-containing protein [Agromyces sp. H3Y2-19a]|uniref:DUF6220 domain-containing protein n=1 Tax=Agromyces TaxID=33877 RepID=UPI001E63D292|nr:MULTISPECIES: DUF6220 domain-containing protein [Agromyces]MCD5346633.1 DUF6220 domain-containing protein [Agromyces sp. S2-1-8]MDF0512993.1 DUF6220 domain-containing protein [Agromyces chromiiresistens]
MKKAFLVTTVLFIVDSMLQVYLAAFGTFGMETGDENAFSAHGINGQIVLRVLALAMIAFAALARAGKRTIWMTVTVFLLTVLQLLIFILTGVIFGIGPESAAPPLPAMLMVSLHGLNGALIIVLGVALFFRARKLVREGSASSQPTTDTVVEQAQPTSVA